MIDNKKMMDVIKSYLPDTDELTYQRIADEIKRDINVKIHSMVRQAVAQEHQAIYKQQSK